MAEFNGENKFEGVYGGISYGQESATGVQGDVTSTTGTSGSSGTTGTTGETVFKKVEAESLPTKQSVWSKIRSFLFQEIDLNAPVKVELTPYQQKVEDEINEFLHQEVSFKSFFGLFKNN